MNLVRCTPLDEIKLSKLSVICIYKYEERMTTKERSSDFDEEQSVPRRENPGYAHVWEQIGHFLHLFLVLSQRRCVTEKRV